ncbi:hypothetical protein [Jiella pacifica]|uniref:Uncharacterized protein n=1 Tax=Jiella pacifica TaxID=2696469 RepID=A0A6N9TBK3_9HYPH|nr:hypothetical protein [Jiella pacifica]NDW07605.1 hypothetical protein [Jiella pacifica]
MRRIEILCTIIVRKTDRGFDNLAELAVEAARKLVPQVPGNGKWGRDAIANHWRLATVSCRGAGHFSSAVPSQKSSPGAGSWLRQTIG